MKIGANEIQDFRGELEFWKTQLHNCEFETFLIQFFEEIGNISDYDFFLILYSKVCQCLENLCKSV